MWPYNPFMMIAATLIEHLLYTLYHTNSSAYIDVVSPSQLSQEVGPIISPHFVGEITEAGEGKVICP